MRRGGRRPRQIGRGDAAVSCPGGRWGRRRTRVTECWAALRAEDNYTALLRDDATAVKPGARGTVTWTIGSGAESRSVSVGWEIRANGVWRRGRVFLACPRCDRRCTRLYLPLRDSWLACRRCWGLTYASRTLQNYKDSLYGRGAFARMFRTSQRDWALLATHEKSKERREASLQRWAKRKRYLGVGSGTHPN